MYNVKRSLKFDVVGLFVCLICFVLFYFILLFCFSLTVHVADDDFLLFIFSRCCLIFCLFVFHSHCKFGSWLCTTKFCG